jgi:hypothetical protein
MSEEPQSEASQYYFECYGGKFDGAVIQLLDVVIEEGIDTVILGGISPGPAYKITDQLIRPNVYKAQYLGIKIATRGV